MAGSFGSSGSLDSLDRLAAQLRVDDAARSRARRASLAGQAAEEATLRGVLVDLGERGTAVRLELVDGRATVGRVRHVGADLVTVHGAEGRESLVALAATACVVPQVGDDRVTGDRAVTSDLTMVEALGWLAGDRPRIQVRTRGGTTTGGELRSAGQDVAALLLDGRPRRLVHVAVATVVEVLVG